MKEIKDTTRDKGSAVSVQSVSRLVRGSWHPQSPSTRLESQDCCCGATTGRRTWAKGHERRRPPRRHLRERPARGGRSQSGHHLAPQTAPEHPRPPPPRAPRPLRAPSAPTQARRAACPARHAVWPRPVQASTAPRRRSVPPRGTLVERYQRRHAPLTRRRPRERTILPRSEPSDSRRAGRWRAPPLPDAVRRRARRAHRQARYRRQRGVGAGPRTRLQSRARRRAGTLRARRTSAPRPTTTSGRV
mmetsp:Transcript_19138/g.59418  ORF Transcript_19138/g.59418 Transcript_19138/m.59418 type:complete len:246 (+) Transcript_19138:37-774(+)